MLERAADDGGGVLVVVDGVFSMEGDIAPLPQIVELCQGPRRAADGRRGARAPACSARAARARRAVRRRGRRRPADGHVLQVAGVLRRLHRRPARGDRLPARSPRGRSCSRPPTSPPRSAPRWPRCGSCARPRGRSCSPACSTTPRYLSRGLHELGFRVIEGEPDDHPGRARRGRRRLEGRAALARALRRRRLRQRRDPPGRSARRRAAAHERDGDPRTGRRSTARWAPSQTSSRTSSASTGRSRNRPV